MYKLYARRGAGSTAVEALLAECDAPHAVEEVLREADGSIPKWFYRVNPRGEVPTLILPDDIVMTESAAMMIYLADLHPELELAPPAAAANRSRYLRWMLYLATTVYLSDLRMVYPARYSTDPTHAPAIKARAIADMAREFDALAEAVGEGPFVLGKRMSAADIYAAMTMAWAPDVAALFARHPNLKALYHHVLLRPKIAKAFARNGL
jgi:GST-like protein